MPDDNKEKVLPEDSQPDNTDTSGNSKQPDSSSGDDWDWDAAVPETCVDNLTEDDEIVIPVSDEVEKDDEVQEEIHEEKETEDEYKDESPEEDDGLCIVCGKKRGKSSSSLYCEECRSKFLRTDYGVGHIILAFVMVLVAAVGYFVCVSTCDISSLIVKAQSYISEKRYDDAVNECSKVTDAVDTLNSGVNAVFTGINSNFASKTWFTEGSRATWLVLDAYTETISLSTNDISTFTQAVDTYYSDKELNSPKNVRIKNCYDFCKDFSNFGNSFAEKWQSLIQGDGSDANYKVPYDETMKYLDTVKTNNKNEECFLTYYRFMTAYYAKKDADTIMGFYKKTYELAGDYSYMFNSGYMTVAWEFKDYDQVLNISKLSIDRNINDATAYYYAVKAYIMKNDFNNAEESCKDMKANNPDGLDYYSIQAEIERRKGDFKAAVDVCSEGIKQGTDAEIYRQQAIAYMLMGDTKNALETIKRSYSITIQNAQNSNGSDSNIIPVLNTTALICNLCKDTETYDEIASIFEQQNAELEDSVKSCIKGEIKFEDIFMKGTGDI